MCILPLLPDNCREQGWLLKNSLTSISQKLLRVRKLYKRFFTIAWTFSITRLSTFFRKTDFFNSHRDYHQLSQSENGSRRISTNIRHTAGWIAASTSADHRPRRATKFS